MSNNESAIRDRIKEMAKLTILSGKINEIQEKNLKHYPFIFFNDVKSVKIEYDLSRKVSLEDREADSSTKYKVAYYLELDEVEQPYLENRFSCLEESVRGLFWKDIKVQVFFNKKLAYESKM